MKLKLLLLTGLLFGASVEAAFPVSIPRNTDSCLVALDGAIEQHKIYATIREQRIHRLKDQLKGISPSDENIYKLNNALYLEYKFHSFS